MPMIQYPLEGGGELAKKIAALERTAWPGSGDEVFPSSPGTYAASFVWLEGGEAVCHAGVRRSLLHHRGEVYAACGLSEVVTHPDWQRRGLASQAVRRAAEFIAAQGADLSIFTCAPERVGFYTRGGWEAVPGACLVGGTAEKPFRSDSLGLVTMMALLSPKALRHREDFPGADIVLELGERQLW